MPFKEDKFGGEPTPSEEEKKEEKPTETEIEQPTERPSIEETGIEKKEPEKPEEIFEKKPLISDNFEIHYDKDIKEILGPDDEKKFDEVKKFVDKTLGSKWEMSDQKVKAYLFSDEKQYFEFLEKKFPEAPESSAIFDKETNSVVKLTTFTKKEDKEELLLKHPDKKEEIEKYFREYPEEEIRNMARGNMFSGVGHELAHLHPLFGGVGNKDSENKWEQEMVCTFIGEKIRTKYGNERLREYQFRQAREELKELQKQGKHFSLEERGKDWDNWPMAERFVYPWLEEKYGLEKLQTLWQKMFKEKKNITESIKEVYNREIHELEEEFQKETLEKIEKIEEAKPEEIKTEKKPKESENKETEIEKSEIEKEDIKTIENLPLDTQDRMNLILTYLGDKPTSEIEAEYYEERPYIDLSEVVSHKKSLEKKLKKAGLEFKVLEIERTDNNGFDNKEFKFFIGKEKEKVLALEKAFKENDVEKEGLLLGFPETAVNAFSDRRKGKKFVDRMLENEKEWWRELPEKEREEMEKERLLNFRNFKLSREYWKEELEKVKEWREKIKKKAPELFEEIARKKSRVTATTEEIEIQKRKEAEKTLEKIRKRVGKVRDEQGKPIEKGIKETVTLLNAFNIATLQSCEGHIKKIYNSAPWVEVYSKLAVAKEGIKTAKRQETIEKMKKQDQFFREKVRNLLDLFYKERKVPPDQMLGLKDLRIPGFRIQSNGAEAFENLGNKEQKKKFPQYKKEMGDFTEFLRDINPKYLFKRLEIEKESEKSNEYLESLKKQRGEKETIEKSEQLRLQKKGEKIYKTEFADKLDEVLEKKFKTKEREEIVLKDVMKEHMRKFRAPEFSKLSKDQKTRIQKEFVKDLTKKMNKIPAGVAWSFYFDRALKAGEMNCLACASLNGLILENTKKITELEKIEFGLPYGHAMNIITFSNGQIYYVDPRNNVFENLSRNIKVEDKNGLKVYKIKELKGRIRYKIIPVLPVKEGVIGSYISNLSSTFTTAKGQIPESLKMTITSPKELKKIQEDAKNACEEKGIDSKSHEELKKLKQFFNKKIFKYQESKEFKAEIKRIKEFDDFRKDLEPISKLFAENKAVKREIISKKNKISRFLLFGTVKLNLDHENAQKEFKKFYQKQKKLRESNFVQYKEFIKQIITGLKSIR